MTTRESLDTFRRACSRFATGITIATVRDTTGTPHGLTVNSFTSVSLDPPLVLICLDHNASVLDCFRTASHFAINVLSEDQQDLSNRFATRGQDRFDGLSWTPGAAGVPLLPDTLAWFECRKVNTIPAGDHDIFIGEVEELGVHEGSPLLYYASRYRTIAPEERR